METEPDSPYFASLFFLFFPLQAIPPFWFIAATLFVLLLLIASAMISSSEVAFFSLSPNDLDKLKQDNNKVSQRILDLRAQPRNLLATILIGNNFINITLVLISDLLLRNVLPIEICNSWAKQLITGNFLESCFSIDGLGHIFHLMITVVGVTFLLVLFGEVAPKVYAKINNLKIARQMSGTLFFLSRLFKPLSQLLVKGTNLIEARFMRHTSNGTVASRKDIDQAIELTVGTDQLADEDRDILKGIVKFGELTVNQIMKSRVDVIAIDFRTTFSELMQVIKDSGYSRIPVYDEDFDNVTGILYVKDLLPHLQAPADFEWQELIRTSILYVPETKKINDLLREFQLERMHMAIVVDEYGGSNGVVTLEDILEEVVGEIRDEFDDSIDVEYEKLDDFNYIFEGKSLLNDVCRILKVDTATFDEVKGDADSLAGLCLEMIGFIPKKGREVAHNQFRFKVVSVNKRRIEQVQVTLPGGKVLPYIHKTGRS